MHIESLAFTATAPGAGGAAAAAVAGDSLTTRNGKLGTAIRALAIWTDFQAVGFLQIATPTGHDQTRGWRTVVAANDPTPILPLGAPFPFQPQELISATIAGSATAGDVETGCALMFYENMPGLQARLARWDDVKARIVRMTTVQASIVSAAGPGYSGTELITAESNLLRANSNYALLGATCQTTCAGIWLQGPDTANQRVIIPGHSGKAELTSQWFPMLSRAYDLPTIPIISAGNKDSTNIGVITDENAGTFVVSLQLGLLDGDI
jgi:hypothetical protein